MKWFDLDGRFIGPGFRVDPSIGLRLVFYIGANPYDPAGGLHHPRPPQGMFAMPEDEVGLES